MTFNTLDFILFLPIVFILYFVLPQKLRNPLLLLASYFFYAVYDLPLTLFLVICTLVTYGIGLVIGGSTDKRRRKAWLVVGVVLNLGTLGFYKYFNFFSKSLGELFGVKETVTLNLLVPLGISFILFQTASYVIDVYRGTLPAEKSLFKFALYVAFFPKLVQGPIERAVDILPQFDEEHHFDSKRWSEGMVMVIYGLFMKMVVADNAAIMVDTVFGNLKQYSGAAIAFAALMFTFQIYYDFAGYSYTAIGAAKVLGFEFKQNFRQPYLSHSVGEFWRRWHMSLNAWLRDYLYIPLGGSRCSKGRRYLNTLITFTLSGLWHGANWGYVIWGFINGVYINLENIVKSSFGSRKAKRTAAGAVGRFLQWLYTFCLVSFAWIFFRAQDLTTSITAIRRIFCNFNFNNFAEYLTSTLTKGAGTTFFGIDVAYGLIPLIIGMLIVLAVDILSEKTDLAKKLADCCLFTRWPVYLFLMFAIILFGVYGYGYNAASFIYANF